MTDVVVAVPVLNRPQRVVPLIASFATAAEQLPPSLTCRLLFVCSPGDRKQLSAVSASGADHLVTSWEPGDGDYARKQNMAFRQSTEEWFFTGADDVEFTPGWLEEALVVHLRTRACVIGTNDAANRRTSDGYGHSTHTLIHRAYGECGTVDAPDSGLILHEGYRHNFCDDEMIGTARARETYAHAPLSVVKHFHPNYGTAEKDATYEKGQAGFASDRTLFQQRKRLWSGGVSRTARRTS